MRSTSCGHNKLAGRKYETKEISLWHQLYNTKRSEAKRKECRFELSFDDFYILSNQECFYHDAYSDCKGGLDQIFRLGTQKGYHWAQKTTINYTGLDRLDNAPLYSTKNVVPCCWTCNTAKSSITPSMAIKLVEELGGRGLLDL
jgi:hypothetical protein